MSNVQIKNTHTGRIVPLWVEEKATSKHGRDKIGEIQLAPLQVTDVSDKVFEKMLSNPGNDIFFAGDDAPLHLLDEAGKRKPVEVAEKRRKKVAS